MTAKTGSPVILAVILYCLAVFLGGSLKNYFVKDPKESDIIERMFGDSRAMVGDWAFIKADEYNHRGLPFSKAIDFHEGESSLIAQSQAGTVSVPEREGEHRRQNDAQNSLFSKIYSNVRIVNDEHLSPSEEKEVLPWFFTEVAFNPHDIRGYVTGAFWLKRMGKNEEALKFLEEGLKNNPDSARIMGSIGQLYFAMLKTDEAIKCLEEARRLWVGAKPPNNITDQYMQSDRFFEMEMLGDIYQAKGDTVRALQVFEDMLRMEPDLQIVKERIERVRSTMEKKESVNDNNSPKTI